MSWHASQAASPGAQIGEPVSEDLTLDEMRSQMALWSIAKSPLIMSTDLRCTPHSKAGVRLFSPVPCHELATSATACRLCYSACFGNPRGCARCMVMRLQTVDVKTYERCCLWLQPL